MVNLISQLISAQSKISRRVTDIFQFWNYSIAHRTSIFQWFLFIFRVSFAIKENASEP